MALPRLKRRRGGGYDTSNIAGLTQLANDSGFGKQAQKINQRIGEAPNQIFSGGFISDIFDVLNTLQYGIVGILKGKGFKEGVKTRQSFSDKDALGDNGIPGVIAGIAMDILVDPLTYIPPLAILKRVPGLSKGAKAVKAGIFGKKVVKPLKEIPGQKLTQLYQDVEGGTKIGKYLTRKFAWIGGADPVYKEAWERMEVGRQRGANNIQKVFKPFSEMSGEAREHLVTRSAIKGREARLIRKPLEQVFKEAGEETGNTVKGVWNLIDGLIDQSAKLGLIPKAWAENKELWIKNAYKEFEKTKGVSGFFRKTFGVKGAKKRAKLLGKETLPIRKALGEIKDPIYPLYKSAIQMVNDIEAVKMNNLIAKNYALDAAQAGFKQVSKSKRFFTSATGEKIEALTKIKNLNKDLKPALKELKKTFKADKAVLSEISRVEKLLDRTQGIQLDEFQKFFQEGRVFEKTVKATRQIGTLPDNLVGIAQKVKKFKNVDELLKSKTGIELEKLFEEGVLERAGFNSVDDFIEHIKNPFKRTAEATRQAIAGGKVTRLKSILKKLEGKKSVQEIKNIISKGAIAKEKLLTGNIGKILDVPGVGKISSLDLQKIGINTIDDLVDVNKTGAFIDDTFDSLANIRKLFGKNTEKVVKSAEAIVSGNEIIEEILPALGKLKNKEDIVKAINKQIRKITGQIGGEESSILNKIVQLQKAIEGLSTKAGKLRALDKRSIDDSFRFLEDTISQITGKKEVLGEVIENAKLGELSGKFVPEWMHEVIEDTVRIAKPGEQATKKIWAGFKYGKVILNPAAHVRNPISNTLLNWWKLGIGPWRVDKYAKAVKEFATDGPIWQRAKKVGGSMNGMASREITDILLSPDGMIAGKKFGKNWRKIVEAPAKMYQAEESIAKLTAFTDFIKKGLTDADAWRKAESATFNYAQVSPFVRKLRESVFGVPFITFGIKAAPIAVETALKHPRRISVFGKVKKAIENATDQKELFAERANEPEWIKDGFYIKLPMKDKNGRSAYFDLTYIIPFGDLASGQLFQRATRRDTQLPESIVSTILSKNPTINFIKEISRNEDFFGNQIWKDSDDSFKQTQDLLRHLTKTYSPQPLADQIPGGYTASGERVQSGIVKATGATEENQRRTLGQEILKNAGIKIQPMMAEQQETFKYWNNKKALETLLKENDVLKGYEINYPTK